MIVCVLIRLGSGSFPSLYCHVTFGCGLDWNGISMAVEEPALRISVSSMASLVNLGGTRRGEQTMDIFTGGTYISNYIRFV